MLIARPSSACIAAAFAAGADLSATLSLSSISDGRHWRAINVITGEIGIRLVVVSTASGPVRLLLPPLLLVLVLVVLVYSTEDEYCRFTVCACR